MKVIELTGKQRRHLRGLAHHLKPVVQLGSKGLSDALLKQITEQLEIHELIKVKLGQDVAVAKKEAGLAVQKACRAALVQVIGRTLVLYRARETDPEIELPKAPAKKDPKTGEKEAG